MRGIYFIASGRKYIEEARKAIKNSGSFCLVKYVSNYQGEENVKRDDIEYF